MWRSTFLMFLMTLSFSVFSNQIIIDSLQKELSKNPTLLHSCELYLSIADYMHVYSPDSTLYYSTKAWEIAKSEVKKDDYMLEFELILAYAENNIGSHYNDIGNIDTALYLYEKAFEGFEKHDDKMGMGIAANNIGFIYNNFRVDIPKAIDYYNKSITYLSELGLDILAANLLNNLATVYVQQGDYKRALETHFKALGIREAKENLKGIGESLSNIGSVYQSLEDFELAKEYYIKSLEIRVNIPDSIGMSYNYNNLASLFMEEKDYKQALNYHRHALEIRKSLNMIRQEAESLGNIGLVYVKLNKMDSAKVKLEKSLEINRELGDELTESAVLGNLGLMYLKKNDYHNALKNGYASYQIALKNDYDKFKRTSAQILYKSYKNTGKADSALKYFEIHTALKDSMLSEDNIKESIKLKTRYEIEREEYLKLQAEKERIRKAEIKENRRNNIQYSAILIALLILAAIILSLGMISVSERQAQGLIFLTFLIFFEFLLVVTDPYVDAFSGGAPAIKLGVNAAFAALIFPLHSFLEQRIKKRVLSKKSSTKNSNM